MSNNKQVGFPAKLRQTLEVRREDILKALPEKIDVDRFITVALIAATKKPELYNCSIESIVLSIMESARVGLYIDNNEAALIPYGNNAEFQPMVQGITNLMLRSPGILKVDAHVVYESDEFGYEYGLYPKLVHKPKPGSRKIVYAYATVWREATDPIFWVVDAEEIAMARSSSRAPNSPAYTKWPGEMAKKFVLKRIAKRLDLSPEASRAIAIDHAVTGDPSMVGAVGGPSDEYLNMLIKNQTEQGLVELKEKIKPKENDKKKKEEKPSEEETEAETEGASVRYKNQWEDNIKDFIIETGLIRGDTQDKMEHRFTAILNASPFTNIPFGELELVPALAWFLAWEQIKEQHPRHLAKNRKPKVLALWNDEGLRGEFLDLATSMIPPDSQQQLI